jgi:hypothetical protein
VLVQGQRRQKHRRCQGHDSGSKPQGILQMSMVLRDEAFLGMMYELQLAQ